MAVLREGLWPDGIFSIGPKAVTNDFKAGDIGYITKNIGYYIRNICSEDLVFMKIFRADDFQDVSLADWLIHSPAQTVAEHFNFTA